MLLDWVWGLGGALLSGLHLWLLRWSVYRLWPSGTRQVLFELIGGSLLRLVTLGGLLFLAFRTGLAAGLFAFAGYWLVRWPFVYWYGRRHRQASD